MLPVPVRVAPVLMAHPCLRHPRLWCSRPGHSCRGTPARLAPVVRAPVVLAPLAPRRAPYLCGRARDAPAGRMPGELAPGELAPGELAPGKFVSAGPVRAGAACSLPPPGGARTLRLLGVWTPAMAGFCGVARAVPVRTSQRPGCRRSGRASRGARCAAQRGPVTVHPANRADDAGTENGADALLRALPRCASGPGDSPRPGLLQGGRNSKKAPAPGVAAGQTGCRRQPGPLAPHPGLQRPCHSPNAGPPAWRRTQKP